MAEISPQEKQKMFGELMSRTDLRTAVERIMRVIRAAFAEHRAYIDKRIGDLPQTLVPTIKALIPAPLKGDKGDRGPQGIPGAPGLPGTVPVVDEEAIVQRTVPQALEILQKNMPVLSTEIRNALELLRGQERISTGAVDGLEQYIIDLVKKHGASYDMGGAAVSVAHNGVIKAQTANAMNFKGAGAPTTTVDAQGIVQLDFPSAAQEVILTATETPNGSTTVFTFSAAAAKPTYVYADNLRLRPTSAAGNTNWSWNAGAKQATMTVAPNDEIYATV